MSLEGYKAVFEIGGVVLLLLTFAFGAGALIVNNRLNAIRSWRILRSNSRRNSKKLLSHRRKQQKQSKSQVDLNARSLLLTGRQQKPMPKLKDSDLILPRRTSVPPS